MELAKEVMNQNNVTKEMIFPSKERKLFWDRIEDINHANNVDKWNELFKKAIESNETISIFSDYDCDGVCSGSLLYRALKIIGVKEENINLIIPDRNIGYGFQDAYLNKLDDSKFLMTCDNGINLGPLFDELSDKLTIIGSDHHKQEVPLSKKSNVVVVDVNAINDKTEFKSISGTATIWKLLINFCLKNGMKQEFLDICRLVDLVGLSTISDVMQLLNENRVYTEVCLKTMNSVKGPLRWAKLRELKGADFTYTDIGWKIAPMINSDSRVNGKPKKAFELLITDDKMKAIELTKELLENNKKRKDIVKTLTDEIVSNDLQEDTYIKEIKDKESYDVSPYAGLIASRLVDKYHRPSIVVVKKDDGYRGSARSIGNFDLINDTKTDDLLNSNFEIHGHAGAAGVHFDDDFDKISTAFNKSVDRFEKDYFDVPSSNIVELNHDLVIEDVKDLMRLEPFGNGFELPQFKMKNVDISKYALIGKDKNHFRLVYHLLHEDMTMIMWNFTEYQKEHKINRKQRYDILGSLQINEFRGKESIQMIISSIM